jgi:thiamine monophosphate kinase
LGGGDDYELCFTASDADERIREVADGSGVTITRVGQVTKGSGLACTRNGEPYDYQDAGYRHFH